MLRSLLHAARLKQLRAHTWSAAGCTGQLCPPSKSGLVECLAGATAAQATVVSSNLQLLSRVAQYDCTSSFARGIISKIHRPAADAEDDEALLGKHAALSESLQKLGLTFSAMMAVIKYGHREKLNLTTAQTRIKQLQNYFGPSMASDMLTAAPELLGREPTSLISNFEALVQALDAGRPFILDVVARIPDILQHRPCMVKVRFDALGETLQVDHAQVLKLVRKAPVLLKLKPNKLQPLVDFMAEVAELTPPEVHRLMLSWPVLASTTIKLIKQRYQAITELLRVTPSEMKRIWSVFPNLLGRDPAQISQNIDALAEKLQVPREDLIQYIRKEPGLLSFNVSTLVNRVVAASQLLKLPPKLSLTLLSYHRPLLNSVSQLPQRLEALQRITGLTGDELYRTVHMHMTVLRFPVDSNEAKFACINSLAQLYEPLAAQRQQLSVTDIIRLLQNGWSYHWRLVYLLHTGQQDSSSLKQVLKMPQAKFKEAYPDFADWLDRYNVAVTAADIPVVGPELTSIHGDIKLSGPRIYQAILPDAASGRGLHAGSLYMRGRAKEKSLGAAFTEQQKASWVSGYGVGHSSELISSINCDSSNATADSSGSHASDDIAAAGDGHPTPIDSRHTRTAADSGRDHLAVTPAGQMAAWLCINQSAAEHLLRLKTLRWWSWSEWDVRFTAAASFFEALNGTTALRQQDASGAKAPHSSDSSLQEFILTVDPAVYIEQQQEWQQPKQQQGSPMLPGTGRRRRRMIQHEGLQSQADVHNLASAAFDPEQPQQQQQQPQQQQQQQRQLTVRQQQHGGEFAPNPLSHQALEYAINTGHAAAVAAVALASHLVPLARQLHSIPPKPPFEVVKFVFNHPDTFAKNKFVSNCNALTTLVSRSKALRQHLQQVSTEQLAVFLACPASRLKYVQYLVQTDQPVPWAITLEVLLLYENVGTLHARFVEKYPDFQLWEEFHKRSL